MNHPDLDVDVYAYDVKCHFLITFVFNIRKDRQSRQIIYTIDAY